MPSEVGIACANGRRQLADETCKQMPQQETQYHSLTFTSVRGVNKYNHQVRKYGDDCYWSQRYELHEIHPYILSLHPSFSCDGVGRLFLDIQQAGEMLSG